MERASLCGQPGDDALSRRSDPRGERVGRERRFRLRRGKYAKQTATTLSRGQFLASLRLPGRDEYLAALDDAVQTAVRCQRTSERTR